MKIDLTFSEVAIIRIGLNEVWSNYVDKNCPKKILKDLNKYHQWCRIVEKDNMSDLYWVQEVRRKINEKNLW
uniref:Uncharacterized protein n=1 Tax=viral metagenome TaxID=1070528 RepID=A0A6M3LTS4_9ZZZZ